MTVPRRRITAAGFEVINVPYPSRRAPIEESAAAVGAELARRVGRGRRPAHFLTHSLGGIVLRALVAGSTPPVRVGRAVMLAPPSGGSQLARRFGTNPLFRAATGPAGRQLGDDRRSVVDRLGPVDFEVGVIAGNRTLNPLSVMLDGPGDGTVSVEEAKLEGMTDFLIVPRGHTFIMNDPAVIDQAIHFFRQGRFSRPADPELS
jgi:hypothetical protein